MMEDLFEGSVLFEVETPLGFQVRVTCAYWDLITTVKHPIMAGRDGGGTPGIGTARGNSAKPE